MNTHLILDPVEVALRNAAEFSPYSDRHKILTQLSVAETRAALRADPQAGDVVSSSTIEPIPAVSRDFILGPDLGGRIVGPLVPVVQVDGESTFAGYETGRANAATVAPPGTTAGLSAYATTQTEAIHSRFAVGLTAEKQVLQDSGLFRLALDWLLGIDLGRALDAEALNGDASTTERWDGILHHADVPTTARVTGTSGFDTVLAAAKAVRTAGWTRPLAVIASTADAFGIVGERDTNGRLYYDPVVWAAIGGIPFASGGLVLTEQLSAGTVVVGSFRDAAHAYLREGATVTVSVEHDDYFTKGLVALLGEARVGFQIGQPSALYVVTGF